jgi:hypothetical protein
MATASSIANLNTIIRWYNNMLSVAPKLNDMFTRGSWSLATPFNNIVVYHMVYSIPMPDLSTIPIKEDIITIIVLNFNSLTQYTSKNPAFKINNGTFSLLINDKILHIQIIPNHYRFINSDVVFIGKDACVINSGKYYKCIESQIKNTPNIEDDIKDISLFYANKLLQVKVCKMFKIIIDKTHESLSLNKKRFEAVLQFINFKLCEIQSYTEGTHTNQLFYINNKQRVESALKFINFELCKLKNDYEGAENIFSLVEQRKPNFVIPRFIIKSNRNNQQLIDTQLDVIKTLDISETQLLDGAFTLFQLSQNNHVNTSSPIYKPIINTPVPDTNPKSIINNEPPAKRVNF